MLTADGAIKTRADVCGSRISLEIWSFHDKIPWCSVEGCDLGTVESWVWISCSATFGFYWISLYRSAAHTQRNTCPPVQPDGRPHNEHARASRLPNLGTECQDSVQALGHFSLLRANTVVVSKVTRFLEISFLLHINRITEWIFFVWHLLNVSVSYIHLDKYSASGGSQCLGTAFCEWHMVCATGDRCCSV